MKTSRVFLFILLAAMVFVASTQTSEAVSYSYSLGFSDSGMTVNTFDGTLSERCGVEMNDTERDEKLQIFYVTVTCFETLTKNLAENTIVSFSDYLRQAVSAALMLSLILFGAKVATGMSVGEKLKGEFIITILKICFVSALVLNYGMMDMWNMTLSTYNGLISIVMAPMSLAECPMLEQTTTGVWKVMDCLFTKFMGYSTENGTGSSWTAVALLGSIFAAKAFSGTNGLFIGAIIGNAILTVILAFVRICCMYLLSMIGLILMFSMSPLIIPLMLFGYTKRMFDDWWKTVISLVIQPVIMFAFFSFVAPMIYDIVMQLIEVYKNSKIQFEVSQKDESGFSSIFNQIPTMLSKAGEDDGTKDTLLNMISITVMAYLILSFINFVSEMAYELSGGGKVPKLANYLPEIVGTGPGALRI